MVRFPVPADEAERLEALRSLRLLDTPPDPAFDRIAALAKSISGAQIALIALLDETRNWFKACVGVSGVTETSRDAAFCAHTVLEPQTLWIEDTRLDPRFHDNPLVTGAAQVRFYAGAAVRLDGRAVGTLCLVDTRPRPHDGNLASTLEELAGIVAEQCRLHRAMADVENASEEYGQLFRCAGEGQILIDIGRDGRLTYSAINPAMEAATGLRAEEVIGATATELFGPQGALLEERCRACAETGRPIEWFETLEVPAGRRSFHTVLSALRDGEGRVARLLLSGRDVTAWEGDRQALRDSERRHREILEALPAAVYTTDAHGRITYFNKAAVDLFGETPQLHAQSWSLPWRLFRPDGTPVANDECVMARSLTEGRAVRGQEKVAERPDGTRVSFVPYPTLLRDDAGSLIGGVNMLVDVTEQRAAESRLRATEETFQLLFDNSGDALFVLSRQDDGGFVYERANREAEAQTGGVEIVGRSPAELLPPEKVENVLLNLEACLAERTTLEVEDSIELDGRARTFNSRLVPIPDVQGRFTRVLASSREVTERRILENRLRASQKLEAMGQLAGGVAHDFNNLLLIIDGYTRQAQKTAGSEELDEVLKAAERGAALVRQLLVFSRRQVSEPTPVRIGPALSDVEGLLWPLLGARLGLRVKVEDACRSLCVETDAAEFGQALLNLAVNARDAMPNGGEVILAARRVSAGDPVLVGRTHLRAPAYVEVSVTDTGYGMDEATASRIFDPFFTTKAPGMGTGLGLAMVYGYAEQSRGAIFVESRLGAGSTFRLLLPLTERAPPAGLADVDDDLMGEGETVLLVEDDPQLLRLGRRMLEELGFRVLAAPDGMAALEIEADHAGDIPLVLTDVVMPSLGGFELAEMVRAVRPESRVVFMSGYPTRGPVQAVSIPEGAIFLPKPFTPTQLARALRRALAGESEPVTRASAA